MKRASVLDALGRALSPCTEEKARRLVGSGEADLVSEDPLVIRLRRVVDLPQPRCGRQTRALSGKRVLLHVCCGPCATYTVKRLREIGGAVTGHWFNPNIHPYGEHERRRMSLAGYADEIEFPVIWEPGYEMPMFLREVVGHEKFRERCLICYRTRLDRTARVAGGRGFDLITTTLLISPYQDQQAIRRIGEEAAAAYGVGFYFENLRRGFAEHRHLAEAHGLYVQRYCGCIYSEWEAADRAAFAHRRG